MQELPTAPQADGVEDVVPDYHNGQKNEKVTKRTKMEPLSPPLSI